MKLFDKEITPVTKACSFNGKSPISIDPCFSLYVRVTNRCNAACPFCAFREKESKCFDPYFLIYILRKVRESGIVINKVSFTGGEPTLEKNALELACKLIKDYNSSIMIVVNTNALIEENLPNADLIDSLAVSTHKIGSRSLFDDNGSEIRKLVELYGSKLHLSCTLGYAVKTKEDVLNYLETYSRLGVEDFGFVTLMKVNKWASDNFVSFSSFDFSRESRVRQTQLHEKPGCRCGNYLFRNSKGKIVPFYARHVLEDTGCACKQENLVLDIDTLRQGFSGQVLLKETF